MHKLSKQETAEHIRLCNQKSQESPEQCARMVSFVLATIQQQLETVPDILADFLESGSDSVFAFSNKATGLDWLQDNAECLYYDALAARRSPHALMRVFLQVPGLGLVKAGFCCQLFAGSVGCLDVHNIRLYGIRPAALRYTKGAAEKTREAKIAAYIHLCQALGGTVELWRAWCEYKASTAPARWLAGGLSVSWLHVECLYGSVTRLQQDLFADADYAPRYMQAAA